MRKKSISSIYIFMPDQVNNLKKQLLQEII